MIRLLLADDHPAFRRGLELMLDDVDDVEVVGRAATGAEAVELGAQLSPDVVLMDLRMPDLDGIEATRRLVQHDPVPAVVVLTMFEDGESVIAAMRAGAAGEVIFGPAVASGVIARLTRDGQARSPAFPSLTQREREVLALIAVGKGNAAIAHELQINLKTVRNHVSNIFTKLQVTDRASAIVKARDAGLASAQALRQAKEPS